jgi:TolB protein
MTKRLSRMVVTGGLVLSLAAPAAAQRLRITVGGPNFRPYPMAAPDLVVTGADAKASAEAARELTALLQTDVDLARSFELVPVKTYLAPEREVWNNPSYGNWQNVGASGLIRGSVDADSKRTLIVLKFFDVLAQREALSKTCQAEPGRGSRCVHQFMDAVVELLTGEPGVFTTKIAFVRRVGHAKAIFTCDVDGGDVTKVTGSDVLNLLPAWDASGKHILFTSYLAGNPDLYRLTVADGKMEPISKQRGLNTGAAVSPDGKRIALTLSVDGNTEIYTMDADGKNLTRLTDSWGQDVSPTWSPDGKRLAFVSSRSGNPHIYSMAVDGSNPRRLTFKGTYNQEPDWSPRADGQIVFTARDEQLKYDVFLVHPDTGEITRLTQDDGNNESPSHSPDGHHIVFTSTRGADHTKQLWVMDVDGSNQRPISAPPGENETPSWGPRAAAN